MDKIKLEIVGLSYSQTQTGAYALVLGESKGKRRLPIIIGNFEAQAIAIELEKMKPSRPLTHDVFKSFAETFDIVITEVVIYNLVEGIFFAKLICDGPQGMREIDARTSDAIALAVRFNCPIYTYEFVLSTAGIVLDDENITEESLEPTEVEESTTAEVEEKPKDRNFGALSMDELNSSLDDAIAEENYELASKIRDEINRRK